MPSGVSRVSAWRGYLKLLNMEQVTGVEGAVVAGHSAADEAKDISMKCSQFTHPF